MNFRQLAAMIPVFDRIETCSVSRTIDSSPGRHVLIVVLRGHLTIAAANRPPVLFAQGYACHPEEGPFDLQVPKTKEAEYAVITYRVFPEQSVWTLSGPLRTLSEVKITYMLDELIRTDRDVHPHSEEEEDAQLFRKRLLMERLLFIFLYETRIKQDSKPSSAVSVEESLSYLQEHYMLKLTLPMLADRAGMSEGHYTVLFKKHTGTTLSRYLRRLRIEKAKQLFMQTHLPAKEVAQRVGFVDYFHFSRIFKQEVGCSPTDFQKTAAKI